MKNRKISGQTDIRCYKIGRAIFLPYDSVPVSVAIDSLEDNGGEETVRDLWCQDVKTFRETYSANNQGNEPVVKVELIVSPWDDN
ncbi:MAG: hypothetical protein V3T06_03495 [Dehalococcoidia bacterium]